MNWIRSSVLKNTLVVLIGFAVALFFGEMTVRLVYPSSYVSESTLGMIGHGGDHDARGFRNEKVVDHAEIVVLGDSQTYGNNAEREEAWPQQLGKIASTTVYQMAFGGYSAVQYNALIDDALTLQPKMLIVAFYAGNDLLETYTGVYDSQNKQWTRFRDPAFVPPATTSNPLEYRRELQTGLSRNSLEFKIWKIRYWFRLHSRLYELLGNTTRTFRERIGVARTMDEKRLQFKEFAQEHPSVAYFYDADERLKTVMSPSYRLEGVNLNEPRTKEGWRITRDIMKYIYEKTHSAGIEVMFVYIPTKEFAYLTYMQLNAIKIPENFLFYQTMEEQLQSEFLAYCRDLDAQCYSVTPALAAALSSGMKIYGETMDGHPLSSGYRVIAEQLAQYIKKTGRE